MELLVVIAITAILMGIMFVPLGRAIDMSARARATIDGQDSVRSAMRQIVQDLSQAVEVYEPRDTVLWGYDQWTTVNDRPRPAAGAVPQPYLMRNGLLLCRLPRQQYYCLGQNHYVTQGDIDTAFGTGTPYDLVALNTCPRHPNSQAELRPMQPIQPDTRMTAYFVALKDPSVRHSNGNPAYENLLLFRSGTRNILNTYTLYRATFELRGIAGQTDRNGNGFDDRYETVLTDPQFFYDPTSVSVSIAGNTQTKPRYQWWLDAARSVLNSETADVVRWLDVNGKYLPHSLCTFGPSPADQEVAQPNRENSLYVLGSVGPADLPPLEYMVERGHWIGLAADGTAPILGNLLLTHTPVPGQQLGPRIQIIDRTSGNTVFDSSLPAPRQRLVSYDSLTGRIVFAFPRRNPTASGLAREYAPLSVMYQNVVPTAQIREDVAVDENQMPASFGAAINAGFGDPLNTSDPNNPNNPNDPVVRIVPGSETVMLADMTDPTAPLIQPLRRAAWTGLPVTNRRDPNNYPTRPLERDEYAINYRTGAITLSDAHNWPSESRQLFAKYLFQTNTNNDIVRVSYTTREMLLVNLGVVQFTRRRGESLPFEVSERVVVRNLKR